MHIIDADWAPVPEAWESPTKTADPIRYSRRCERIRRNRDRKWDRRVRNLFTASLGLLALAAVMALLVG